MLDGQVSASSAAATSTATSSSAAATAAAVSSNVEKNPNSIKIVFSDLDGTLIHYPKKVNNNNNNKNNNKLLKFPPSSTGLTGVISAKTLSLVDEIRNENKVKFVLISGMRTSTLLQRLPYLPRADAYCSENGGRIFYPVEAGEDKPNRINDGEIFWIQPKKYIHDGNSNGNGNGRRSDLHQNKPFGIREDKAWRERMTASIGGDSFGSFSLKEIYDARDDPKSTSMPLHERDGFIWDFARELIHTHGFVLDTKGYSTCFRFNKKQQTSEAIANTPHGKILALLDADLWAAKKASLASSVNLSCVDFYPSCSGKKNCCLYLASKFFPEECEPRQETIDGDDIPTGAPEDASSSASAGTNDLGEDFLSKHAVCMCDDDNDLEMAMACNHAYLPDIASQSMVDTIDRFPNHFTTTFRGSEPTESEGESSPSELESEGVVVGTDASDLALSMIWEKTYEEMDSSEK